MWEAPPEHPLRRLFSGLAEHAFFAKFGIADPPLIDYLSVLLARFVHADDVYRLRNGHGRPIHELVDMVVEAEALPPGGRTRREYFRHIGDFALFWTGVFPEALNAVRAARSKDALVNYTAQGKRAYSIAGAFDDERFRDEAPVLRRLSEEFEVCALGLREVRREWEELRNDPLPPGGAIIR